MLQHDWIVQRLAEEHRCDLIRQLEQSRLTLQIELARHPQRHRVYHMLDWVGRQLIHWGKRLQARHATYHRQTLNHTLGG